MGFAGEMQRAATDALHVVITPISAPVAGYQSAVLSIPGIEFARIRIERLQRRDRIAIAWRTLVWKALAFPAIGMQQVILKGVVAGTGLEQQDVDALLH